MERDTTFSQVTMNKSAEVYSITALIVFLLGGLIHLDWSRLYTNPLHATLSPYTEGCKLTIAYLTAILTWRVRVDQGDAWSTADALWLRKIFVLIALADTCFIAQNPPPGILIFMAVQAMFIMRHFDGYNTPEGKAALLQHKMGLLALYGSTLAFCATSAAFFWYPRTGINDTFIILAVYFCFKCTSVLASFAAIVIGKMPRPNSILVATGMASFFICDHTVTGNLLFSQETEKVPYIITSSLTWMFYGPALTLLALSGYHPSVLALATGDTATVMNGKDKQN